MRRGRVVCVAVGPGGGRCARGHVFLQARWMSDSMTTPAAPVGGCGCYRTGGKGWELCQLISVILG